MHEINPMVALATRTVLLVEDNPGDVSLIMQAISGFASVQLFHVPNVVQANQLLLQKPPFEDMRAPDLILLDLKLPIFHGTSVLQTVRETPRLMHLPVIVLTSSMLPSDVRRCADLGASEYVTKPVEWCAWQQVMRAILRKYFDTVE